MKQFIKVYLVTLLLISFACNSVNGQLLWDALKWKTTTKNASVTVGDNGDLIGNVILSNEANQLYRCDLRYEADVVLKSENPLIAIKVKPINSVLSLPDFKLNIHKSIRVDESNDGKYEKTIPATNNSIVQGLDLDGDGINEVYYWNLLAIDTEKFDPSLDLPFIPNWTDGVNPGSTRSWMNFVVIVKKTSSEDLIPSYLVEGIRDFATEEDIVKAFSPLVEKPESKIFTHPGLSHKTSDLQRMKAMIEAKTEPYYSSFLKLKGNELANYNYQVKGQKGITSLPGSDLDGKFGADSRAAYMNALMWNLTGDERHAKKAVEILNTYNSLTYVDAGATAGLGSSKCYLIIEAAELIKNTYDGWLPEDIQLFKDMLVYPGYSTEQAPASIKTFYWNLYRFDSGRHGNQEFLPMRACMAMGIFLDNEIMYDRALRYFKGMPHREDDLPYDAGPGVFGSIMAQNEYFITYHNTRENTIPDYGFNGVLEHYIWENGQCQESSRDQDHAILGMGVCASIAEIAWNQGDDAYSLLDNRILKGYEFAAHYNVSYKHRYDDQPESWEPTVENGEFIRRKDRTGRWESLKINPHYESDFIRISRGNFYSDKRPVWEMPLAHYQIRMGISSDNYKWTLRAHEASLDSVGIEQSGWTTDHLGWGGLTFHRPEGCAGDPCRFEDGKPVFAMNNIPGIIEAENYDYFTGDGEGRTYHELSANRNTFVYRNNGGVNLKENSNGGFQVTDMEDGEWLNYTVYVPVSGTYDVLVNYQASSFGGKLKIDFAGTDKTGEVLMPEVAVLTDYTLASKVYLSAGVQSMRVFVTGISNVLELNNIQVKANMEGQKSVTLSVHNENGAASLSWELSNMVPSVQKIYRATDDDFASATLLADEVSGLSYLDSTTEDGVVYYYWVECINVDETVRSESVEFGSVSGLINDTFTEDINVWEAATSGAIASISNGQFVMKMALQANSKYRGDMRRISGATLHAGYYPILAIKIQRPEIVNITFDTEKGAFGNGSNKFTGTLGTDVLYYDLTSDEFFHSSGNLQLPLDEPYSFSRFQFKVADVTSGEDTYTVDWVKTFTSVKALEEYTGLTVGVINEDISKVDYVVIDKRLYLRNLSGNSKIKLYNMQGSLLTLVNTNSVEQVIDLQYAGMYLLNVCSESASVSFKILVK